MKNTSIILLFLFISLFPTQAAVAQYNSIRPFALGLRGCPDGGGANARFFFSDLLSAEAQFNVSGGTQGGAGKAMMGGGLLMLNAMLYGPEFRLFVGGGAHYGSWERYRDISKATSVFGFDAVIGLEYTFNVPISVSLDYKPAFNYISGVTYMPNNVFGLGIRYYFGAWEDHVDTKADSRE
jgi:hypothetical protein